MRRPSGYVDGLISGATWGVVAVLLARLFSRMQDYPLLAMLAVVSMVLETAAALFLLARAAVMGALPRVGRLLTSRTAVTVLWCGVLGGPIFMGGYVAALILAGPADALTAIATYPVFGALLARRVLGQRLNRIAWLGVTAAGIGAALTAFDADSSANKARTLAGVAIGLAAAVGLALDGIVATRAMARMDPDTVAVAREMFVAVLFAVAVLIIPGGISLARTVVMSRGFYLPTIVAGFISGYSYMVWYHAIRKIGAARAMALNITYAMWGILFALIFRQAGVSPLAVAGCVIVSVGAVLTIMSGQRPARGAHHEQPQERLDPQGNAGRGSARDRSAP
jgi:drug/metabolite transporter (DMT)-like permease